MNTKQTITAATGQLANPTTPPIWSEKKIELPFNFPFIRLFFEFAAAKTVKCFGLCWWCYCCLPSLG